MDVDGDADQRLENAAVAEDLDGVGVMAIRRTCEYVGNARSGRAAGTRLMHSGVSRSGR